MLDVEPEIVAELDRLAATPVADSDWADVLARADVQFAAGKRRVALLAGAALLAFAVVAVAIAATFGGFRTWLTGEPGKPASATAQAAFDRTTRGWRGFPRSTSLRQLVTTDVDGVHYELDGFRGAGSLCLRLIAGGSATASSLSCAPLAELRNARAPALVLAADTSIGNSGRKVTEGPLTLSEAQAAVSFGVVADGVDSVRVTHRRPAATRTFVSGDAFLAVTPHLSPFNATATIVASAGGTQARVPFVRGGTPFSFPPPIVLPSPRGPSTVQRHVTGGTILWLARREPRGESLPRGLHHVVGASKNVIFARMITPDPGAPERMIVSIGPAGNRYFNGRLRNNRQVCAELVGGRYEGAGCWPAGRLFSTEPFTIGVGVQRGGQVMTVTGLAADSVAKLRLFTATGGIRSIPLHDNGYIAAVTIADFPLRLVAYDDSGSIIGNKTIQGSFGGPAQTMPSPAPGAHWTEVLRNTSGSVYTVRATSGGICIAFRQGGGVSSGCGGWSMAAPSGLRISVGSDRRHSYVEGVVGSRIHALRITLRDGKTIVVSHVHRYVLYRLAKSALRDPSAAVKTIEGLDGNGKVLVRQRQ